MFRRLSLFAVAATMLSFPTGLFAGGPPCLNLPIDGVTADNAGACAKLLAAKLEGKLSPYRDHVVDINQVGNQWYVSFSMGSDVRLSEIEAALAGSGFSIPRDKIRFFGHVILETDAHSKPQELLADLEALNSVTVAQSESTDGLLAVTVEMPYPVESAHHRITGSTTFRREGTFKSSTTAHELPGYNAFRDVVAKRNSSLKDIRFSVNHWCRPQGCVTAPDTSVAVSGK